LLASKFKQKSTTMTDKYINPFTDFGFKKIFGEESNKDLLIDFIHTLLPHKKNILSIRYLQTEKLGRANTERRAVFDLYCENDQGEKFIVELQRAEQEYFKERSIYYATFAIQEQAQKGKWNYNWQGVYTIAIMDFTFPQMMHPNVKSEIVLYDQHNQVVFSDKLQFIYLEMSKFNKTLEELETYDDKWLFLLKNLDKLYEIPEQLREKAFLKIFQLAEIAKYKPKERQNYEQSLKEYRDLENSLELKYEKGKKEGRKEGRREGRREGRIEGKIEIAFNAIKKGFDDQTIADLTGLSIEDIQKLRTT